MNFSVKNVFQVTPSSSWFSRSAGSSECPPEGLQGQVQCGALGLSLPGRSIWRVQPLQHRTGTCLEALDAVYGC